MKKTLCLMLCVIVALSMGITASAENYSSVIPDSLVLEMCTGGYQSQWIVIKGQEQVLDNAPTITADDNKKFENLGINIGKKSMSWNDKANALVVGKFKNSMSVMTFQNSNKNWSNLNYLGAVGFNIKNITAGEKGYAAVIAKRKWDYSNNMAWGGYGDETVSISGNTMLAGYTGYNNVMTWQYSNSGKINGGYLVVGLMAEKYVDLEKTYFALYITHVTNNSIKSRALIGVPISRYYSENDKGEYKEVAIPISDFETTNPWVKAEFVTTDSTISAPDKIELKFTGFLGSGLMRLYDEQYVDQEDSNKIYLTKQQIVKVAVPTSLTASKIGENTCLQFSLGSDNSVSAVEVTQKDSAGDVKSKSKISLTDSKISCDDNGVYTYDTGESIASGTVFGLKAVAEYVAGNETVGFSDIKSKEITTVVP